MSNPAPIAALDSATTAKTPEVETNSPTQIQPTNGVLKRHAPLRHLRENHQTTTMAYKECRRNYLVTTNGHVVDGCQKFMPSFVPTLTDPLSLKCAACGCHRNFHRQALQCQSENRYPPRPPSPPIISARCPRPLATESSKKRFRTKFSRHQKDKMLEFAKEIGWKMQKKEENKIIDFCIGIGVRKDVFKVWMHNHKNTSGSYKIDQKDAIVKAPATKSVDVEHHRQHDGDGRNNGEGLIQRQQNENISSSGHEVAGNGNGSPCSFN